MSWGSMEVYNAMVLFERSKEFGFRYSTYVADRDNKVLPALIKLNPYPIEKFECSNHLQKIAQKSFVKFGANHKEYKVKKIKPLVNPKTPPITIFF